MHDEPNRDGDSRGFDGSLDDELLADDLDYGLATDDTEGANWPLVIGVLVVIGAVSFLVFDGMKAETYFFDVHEAVERSDELVDETIRVRGTVQADTLQGSADSLQHRFDIATQGESMTISYDRALPDTFEEDSEVVAQGRLDERGVLRADEVLVKCPSRYEGAPPSSEQPLGESPEGDPEDGSTDPRASR